MEPGRFLCLRTLSHLPIKLLEFLIQTDLFKISVDFAEIVVYYKRQVNKGIAMTTTQEQITLIKSSDLVIAKKRSGIASDPGLSNFNGQF